MPESLEIREATLSDIPAIVSLMADLGYPTSAETMKERLAPIFRDPEHGTFVALRCQTVVGIVGTRVGRRYEEDGRYGQVMIVVVRAHDRRRGVGSALMKHAEESLRQQGANAVVVNTGSHRTDAHAFYERMGYSFTGRRYAKTVAPA